MTKTDEIRRKLAQCKPELESGFQVKEIGMFGSYVRGEQTRNSDLDILVEFEKAPGLFKFLALEERLQTILKVKVDLVMKSALKPRIGKRILSEVVYA
ncbi:MAG: nucleotidyltransferase family protein [Kiritimatiellia bacterium]|nr:nucleotidyltransferase family protein [Kiritimatiellia bacterium]